MEEQKQYREDLLEWCNNIDSNWESMKPRFSKLFNMEILEEWEGSCRQLKEKLQADINVDFDDYLTAKSLYEQWEQLFKESNAYQEEMEVDSNKRLELEEQKKYHEENLETDAFQEKIELETHKCMDLEEQLQYREDLLEWCNNIYSNWESMKLRFSQLFDMESLEEWEGSCRQLKEKLQADIKVDFDDYLTAKSLYEQWEQLFKETSAYQEEMEIDSDNHVELEGQTQFQEELLETDAYQEEMEIDSDERLELEEQKQFHEELLATDAFQEEIEIETEKFMDLDEQLQYREYLLEWCNNIYSNWESMKPRFSKLFDLKSLEEWEESCRQLKEKLQADINVDFDDYQTAKSLYEQWEQLFKESLPYKEEIGV